MTNFTHEGILRPLAIWRAAAWFQSRVSYPTIERQRGYEAIRRATLLPD